MKAFWKQFAFIGVGLLIALLLSIALGLFSQETFIEVIGVIMDGAFITSITILGITGLMFASNDGFFDMMAYSFRLLIEIPFKRPEERKYKDFYQYKEAKGDKRVRLGHLLVTGLSLLIFTAILAGFYYTLR